MSKVLHPLLLLVGKMVHAQLVPSTVEAENKILRSRVKDKVIPSTEPCSDRTRLRSPRTEGIMSAAPHGQGGAKEAPRGRELMSRPGTTLMCLWFGTMLTLCGCGRKTSDKKPPEPDRAAALGQAGAPVSGEVEGAGPEPVTEKDERAALVVRLTELGDKLLVRDSGRAVVAYQVAMSYDPNNAALKTKLEAARDGKEERVGLSAASARYKVIVGKAIDVVLAKWEPLSAEMQLTEMRMFLDERLVGDLQCANATNSVTAQAEDGAMTLGREHWIKDGFVQQELLPSGWPKVIPDPWDYRKKICRLNFFMAEPALTLAEVQKEYGKLEGVYVSVSGDESTTAATYGRIRLICREGKVIGVVFLGY